MKVFGYVLLILGIIALVVTGINYINETESFSLLGLDVVVSKGNVLPMIISLLVAVIGLFLIRSK